MTWASFVHRYGEHGGGDLPGFAWTPASGPRTPARARSTRSTASCSCSRRGSVRNAALRRVARHSCTATTSTSACRRAPRGARSSTADLRAVHHHSLELVERPGGLGRGAHPGRREVGRADARAPPRRRRLAAARPARRGRGRGRARRGRLARSCSTTPASASYRARARGDDREHRLARSPRRCGALNHWRRLAPAAALPPPRLALERPPDLVLANHGGSRAMPARRRSRDSRSATANALDSAAAAAPPPGAPAAAGRAPPRTSCDVRRGEVEDAVGLEPRQHRVAIPGREQRGDRVGPGASRRQTTPRPKKAGTTASRSSSRPATKSSTAVSTPLRGPPSRAAAPAVRQPARADPGLVGEQPAALVDRLAMLGGDLLAGRSSRRAGACGQHTSWNSSSGSSRGRPRRSAAAPR